jgi:hypothetical protein
VNTPPEPPPNPPAASRRLALLGGLGASAAVLGLMLATEPSLTIAWDEAYTLNRLERVHAWFEALADPPAFARGWKDRPIRLAGDKGAATPLASEVGGRGDLLSPRVVDWFWPFAREEPNGHPPFYAEVALAGDVLTPWRPKLSRARLGTILAFSLAAGAIFAALAGRFGAGAGAAGAGAWALQPHLFALGHYATYDALLASLWVGAILAFARAVRPGPGTRRGAAVAFGVLLGWAMGTKLTGWLLPLPMLAWSALYRDRRGFATLAAGVAVASLTLYAFTPPFWGDPLGGLARFFASNLSRAETIPIRTMFLGRVYETPRESLPFYNTLAWTAMVTPVGFLLLALAGAWRALRGLRSRRFEVLVLGHWAFLLLLRALPHTPGHDGVRQFLPAFGCLALMAGVGAAEVRARLGRRAGWVAGAAIAEGAASVALLMPVPLSYFSPVVGGLPGATRLGMEPTYYWDALTFEALARLDERTPPGGAVLFAANPIATYYTEAGLLTRGRIFRPGDAPDLYVVQNRPGAMSPLDRALVRGLGSGGRYVLSSKFGVPLVWAFPGSALEAEFRRDRRP